ncbi:MAG TPA: hypothetical protein H9815_05660 [Candidatus Ruania gallistercoris]|uniref:Uncharacterized protein n=1 Tax=Candidatus Ruania gallistercoris TaxID=2838746 RepID=A0A9D2J3K8_9MICO|nr:hypothetical protein [Candidatus Ruania gallistercoris]
MAGTAMVAGSDAGIASGVGSGSGSGSGSRAGGVAGISGVGVGPDSGELGDGPGSVVLGLADSLAEGAGSAAA